MLLFQPIRRVNDSLVDNLLLLCIVVAGLGRCHGTPLWCHTDTVAEGVHWLGLSSVSLPEGDAVDVAEASLYRGLESRGETRSLDPGVCHWECGAVAVPPHDVRVEDDDPDPPRAAAPLQQLAGALAAGASEANGAPDQIRRGRWQRVVPGLAEGYRADRSASGIL